MPPSSDHFIARLWLLFSLSALNVSSAYNLPTILFRLMAQLSNFLISEWGTYTPSLMLADFNLLGHNKSDTYLKPTAYSSWCFDPFSFTIEIVWFQKVSLACTVFTNIRVSSWLCRTLKSLQPLIKLMIPNSTVFYLYGISGTVDQLGLLFFPGFCLKDWSEIWWVEDFPQ